MHYVADTLRSPIVRGGRGCAGLVPPNQTGISKLFSTVPETTKLDIDSGTTGERYWARFSGWRRRLMFDFGGCGLRVLRTRNGSPHDLPCGRARSRPCPVRAKRWNYGRSRKTASFRRDSPTGRAGPGPLQGQPGKQTYTKGLSSKEHDRPVSTPLVA